MHQVAPDPQSWTDEPASPGSEIACTSMHMESEHVYAAVRWARSKRLSTRHATANPAQTLSSWQI